MGGNDIFLVKYNSSGTKQWTKQFGNSSVDSANGLAIDSSNNIYVTGMDNGTNFFLGKYNSSGTEQWQVLIGGTASFGYKTIVDSSDNIYVAGYTSSYPSSLHGNSSAGSVDGILLKYDSSGTRQWTKQFGSSGYDMSMGITVDNSSNIYVTGYTDGGLDTNTNSGGNDAFIIKYNSSGTKQWTKQFGTSGYDITYGRTAVDSSNNIYITGQTGGGLHGNTNSGDNDTFLVKYNDNGTREWTKQFGTSAYDIGTCVVLDSSNNIYVGGTTSGGLDGNTNYGGFDIFLVKYNSSGTKQWTKQFGSSGNESTMDIALDSSDNIHITGTTDGELDGKSNSGQTDIFLIKYNSDGVLQ